MTDECLHTQVNEDSACVDTTIGECDPASTALNHTLKGYATAISYGPFEDGPSPDRCPVGGPPCEDQTGSFTVEAVNQSASDLIIDGDVVVAPDGTLSFTIQPDAYGEALYYVKLTDSQAEDDTSQESKILTLTISISPVNDPPVFSLSATIVTVDEGSGTYSRPDPFVDLISADNPSAEFREQGQDLSFFLTTDIDIFTQEGRPAVSPDGYLTFTLMPHLFGTVNVTIVLQDSGGGDDSASASFLIVVAAVNDPPSFVLGQTAFQASESDETREMRFLAAVRAISAGVGEDCREWDARCTRQELTFVMDDITNLELFTRLPSLSPYGTLTMTVAPKMTGSARVVTHLEDDGDSNFASLPQSFTITVTAVNDPPAFELPWNVSCDNVGIVDADACTCPSSDKRDDAVCVPILPGVFPAVFCDVAFLVLL